jgi:hypothetical protein
MTITNVPVVDTISKYNVKSTGIGSESNQVLVDASKLYKATNESLVSLIECYYLIEGTGTLTISGSTAPGETNDLSFTGKGKYGLRPDQLKFGDDKQLLLTTDSDVKSYLLVTEFRRNN